MLFHLQFESIANELLTHTEEILNSKNTGVVLNLCQACERFESKQDDFVRVSVHQKKIVSYTNT